MVSLAHTSFIRTKPFRSKRTPSGGGHCQGEDSSAEHRWLSGDENKSCDEEAILSLKVIKLYFTILSEYRTLKGLFTNFEYIEKKTPKNRWNKTLEPQNKRHRTWSYQSLSNTWFSLLYSHAGYSKQWTIHKSRMIQHSLRYYCNSALLKLYTHNYLHAYYVTV